MSRIDAFRIAGIVVLFIVCVGILVSPTGCQGEAKPDRLAAIQEYEAALHIWRMELAITEELERLDPDEATLARANGRLERAKQIAREAEERLARSRGKN